MLYFFVVCWGFGMAFSRKEEDGKYFSIFNENSCAKISGEFYMYLVFNLKECFMPELEHHPEETKN